MRRPPNGASLWYPAADRVPPAAIPLTAALIRCPQPDDESGRHRAVRASVTHAAQECAHCVCAVWPLNANPLKICVQPLKAYELMAESSSLDGVEHVVGVRPDLADVMEDSRSDAEIALMFFQRTLPVPEGSTKLLKPERPPSCRPMDW